jgi:hypothetical protein
MTKRTFWSSVVLAAVCHMTLVVGVRAQQAPSRVPQVSSGQSPAVQIQAPPLLSTCLAAEDDSRFKWSQARHSVHRLVKEGQTISVGRRIHLMAGLMPSTNIAAQAGSIDATVSAMAWTQPVQINRPAYPRRVYVTRMDSASGCAVP